LLVRLRGTFAPFFRASESPIAMACLRLFTVPPLPPRPLLRVPFFRRRIALSTRFDADFPYRRPLDRFDEVLRFAAAIGSPRIELASWTETGAAKNQPHESKVG
jgi:hypothetical protein